MFVLVALLEEFSQSNQIIGIDQIHSVRQHFVPKLELVRSSPKAHLAAFLMSLVDYIPEALFVFRGDCSRASPMKSRAPVVTDPGNQGCWILRVEVRELSIISCIAHRLSREHVEG